MNIYIGDKHSISLNYINMGNIPVFRIPLRANLDVLTPNIATELDTFARSTTGDFVDYDGVTKTAPINVPRFTGTRYEGGIYYETDDVGNPIPETTLSGVLIKGIDGPAQADQLSYDISSLITQGEGSLYCQFSPRNPASYIITLSDGTANNRLVARMSTDTVVCSITVGGVTSTNITSISIPYNADSKIVMLYQDNDLKLYLNGFLVGSATSFTVPNFTELHVGQDQANANQLNGNIKDIRYYDTVISEPLALIITESRYLQTETGSIILDENDNAIEVST